MNDSRRVRYWRSRAGQTLLELVGATTIIATALIPALRIMRDSIRISRDTEISNLLATYSASKLEEHLVRTAVLWDTTTDADFIPGYQTQGLRYQVVKLDEGIGSGLMRITSTAWEDADGDGSLDAGEMRSVYASKLARNAAYQQEANGL